MVVSLVQHVVPGESVVEPDIENLVSFLEFVNLTVVTRREQIFDWKGKPGVGTMDTHDIRHMRNYFCVY